MIMRLSEIAVVLHLQPGTWYRFCKVPGFGTSPKRFHIGSQGNVFSRQKTRFKCIFRPKRFYFINRMCSILLHIRRNAWRNKTYYKARVIRPVW